VCVVVAPIVGFETVKTRVGLRFCCKCTGAFSDLSFGTARSVVEPGDGVSRRRTSRQTRCDADTMDRGTA